MADISSVSDTTVVDVSGCWTLMCQYLCLLHIALLLQRKVPFSDVTERSTRNFVQVFQHNVLPVYHAEITKIRNFEHILISIIP
jgi:hypothetical protein